MEHRLKIAIIIVLLILAVGMNLPQITGTGIAQGPVSSAQSDKSFAPPPEWRPTAVPAGRRMLGNATCGECHTQVKTQPQTTMGKALELASESRILSANPDLNFRSGRFIYNIRRDGDRSIYTVSDGRESISVPILYAFGLGKAGQTYVFEREGRYYESRVSFYDQIGGLDYTIGAPRIPAASLAEAVGRAMDSADLKDCFGCHATAAVAEGRLQLDKMTPGISCEGCHGPGDQHVALMKSPSKSDRRGSSSLILNPGRFDTEGQTQFCGSCHRTWAQVELMRVRGVDGVRFQPYRIFSSKCYDFDDRRIACSTCHNPHEEVRPDPAFYDAKCLACHRRSDNPATTGPRPCRASPRSNCAGCHMPKYEIPGSHFQFTDHQIRVVRPGDLNPEQSR